MGSLSKVVLLALTTSAFCMMTPMEDVMVQQHKKLRCFQQNDDNSQLVLSEPIWDLCLWHFRRDSAEPAVNGLNKAIDSELEKFQIMFSHPNKYYAVTVSCVQEVMMGFAPTFRCLCNRDGCNVPKNFTDFLAHNKDVIQI